MNSSELGKTPQIDDFSILLEQFKMGLTGFATGETGFTNDEYSRIRKLVLDNPSTLELAPQFLKICRNLGEFWQFIKGQSGKYVERRRYIAEALNPIIDLIEYQDKEGSLEFSKNYQEIELIGSGGFGVVYLFEHKLLKLNFAVKIFAPAFSSGGEKELERFFQEARMLFSLNHPNIIKIYDAGLIGKRPFIRMEFFGGQDIYQFLAQNSLFNTKDALIVIENIVLALKYAHEKMIIHRDLKPSNILISQNREIRVIDFGLGIFIENELHSRITKTGEHIIGGLYNAPELIQNPSLIDKRSDIYSIGAIWFTLLTGQPPAGTTISKQLSEIEGMTLKYASCIEQCLANIEYRYILCDNLLEEIQCLKKEI